MMKTYLGSCHCGDVTFEADLDLAQGSGRCNCSICTKRRSWSVIVKPAAFRLLRGADKLSDYQFATHSVHHRFCAHCGCAPFGEGHVPEIGGDYVAVAVHCLDELSPEELAAIPVRYADGGANEWRREPELVGYL